MLLYVKWATENTYRCEGAGKSKAGQLETWVESAKGQLTVGAKADVVVFDVSAPWVVSADTLVSAGKNTPFAGYELEGRTRYTLVGGEVRYASS